MSIGSRAKHWNDFEIGERLETCGRTVESGDVSLFAGLSGDFNPMHIDEVHASKAPFGTRIAHGLLTLAISSGQLNQLGVFEGTTLGFLGMDDVRFSNPVRFGDTVRTIARIVGARASAKPGRGVVSMKIEVVNQKDEIVLAYDQALLMSGRA
ncbi:MAG TPA: MaoC/PaaZ C-terminal domain-containing protein [Burkholderiaceae bacterium]|nr:MaoC/PaaZ C-terminal domain-containing protein [Burkholderiaceae bacterium]